MLFRVERTRRHLPTISLKREDTTSIWGLRYKAWFRPIYFEGDSGLKHDCVLGEL